MVLEVLLYCVEVIPWQAIFFGTSGTALLAYFLYTYSVSRVATPILYLFRKKIILGASVLTTFSLSLRTGVQALADPDTGFGDWRSVFVGEVSDNFVGAAGHIAEGLSVVVEVVAGSGVCGRLAELGLLGGALWSIWVGVSAVYMLAFLWSLFRGRVQKTDVDFLEHALVVTVLLLATAVLEGTAVLESVFDNLVFLADALAQAGGDTAVNQSANSTG